MAFTHLAHLENPHFRGVGKKAAAQTVGCIVVPSGPWFLGFFEIWDPYVIYGPSKSGHGNKHL